VYSKPYSKIKNILESTKFPEKKVSGTALWKCDAEEMMLQKKNKKSVFFTKKIFSHTQFLC
jgi:hypothetical protein